MRKKYGKSNPLFFFIYNYCSHICHTEKEGKVFLALNSFSNFLT